MKSFLGTTAGGTLSIGTAILSFAAFLIPANAQTIRLNTPGESFLFGVSNFDITPDSQRVIYRAELGSTNRDLFSASTSAEGTQIQLNSGAGTVDQFVLTPDGSRVIFTRTNAARNRFDLLGASTAAAATEVMLREDVSTGALFYMRITADGSQTVFLDSGTEAFFSASTTVPGVPLRLTTPFRRFASIVNTDLVSTPQGNRLIFSGDITAQGQVHVYSARLDTPENQIRLSSAPFPDVRLLDGPGTRYAVTPDGASVVYISNFADPDYGALYRASTTAVNTQEPISSRAHSTGEVSGFLMKPGASTAYYVGNLGNESVFSLYEASTEGTPNQRVIYTPSILYSRVREVSLSPDSAHLIFRGDLFNTFSDELFIASTTFTQQPRRISGQTPNSGVTGYRIAPNSAFVVYEESSGQSRTLWAVSTSGNFAPVRIAPPPGESWRLSGLSPAFRIRPDSQAVLFTAAIPGGLRNDLFAVTVPPLNGTPNPNPPGAAVSPVEPSPSPGPGDSDAAPTLAITGKKKIKTTGKPATIKGVAADDRAIVSVLASYRKTLASGKKKTISRPAKLSAGTWTFRIRPVAPRTKVTFVARDDAGQSSTVASVKVIRK